MIRKKTYHNIIILAVGTIFYEKRKGKEISSVSLAAKIGIADGSLRSFENGNRVISIDKFIILHKLDPLFIYQKTLRLLTGLHIVFKCKSDKQVLEEIETIRNLGDTELANVFFEVKKVFEEIKNRFTKSYSKKSIKNLDSFWNLKTEIEKFLTKENLLKSSTEYNEEYITDITTKLVEKIPSYDLDDVLTYIDNRLKKPLLIKNDTIEQWERDNTQYITKVVGITDNVESITSLESIREFDYDYLFKPSFDSYNIIFFSQPKENKIFEDFEKAFKKINSKISIGEIDLALSKVKFKFAEKRDVEEVLKAKMNDNLETDFENFWSYRLKGNRIVNFLSNRQNNTNNFLGVSEQSKTATEKMRLFDDIWRNL